MEHSEEKSHGKSSQSSLEKKIDIMQYARTEMHVAKEEIREMLKTDIEAYKKEIRERNSRIVKIAVAITVFLVGSNIWAWFGIANKLHEKVQGALNNEVTIIRGEVKNRLNTEFDKPVIRKTVQEVAASSAQQILRNEIQPEVEKFTKQTESNLYEIKKSVGSAQSQVTDLSATTTMMDTQIKQVKKLALALTTSAVTSTTMQGQIMRYIHLKYKIEEIDHYKAILRDMSIPEKDIKEAVDLFVSRVRGDHMRHILLEINKLLPDGKKLFKDIYELDIDGWDMKRVRQILKENNIKEQGDLKETILDWEYYEKTGKLRREKMWQS
jgi:hypothetical protein